MGRVRVECARGCSCQPVTLDGHNQAKISPYDLHYLTVQTHNTTAAANTANAAAAAAAPAPAPVAARRLGALSGRKEVLRARKGAQGGTQGAFRARRSPRLLRATREAAMGGSAAMAGSTVAAPTPAPPSHCALRLTVLNQTSSEAHKFKLTALFLNRESDKAFFGGWIFRKAMDSKEKDMGKGDGWGASFRKVAGDRERRGRSRKASAKGGGRLRKVAKANKGG